MKLSAALITLNEEDNLARTLEPLQGLADEIVIVDSGSTDRTLEIARAAGAKVFQEDWKGYVEQKNSAFAKCSGDWILNLDADEVLTPELAEEIRAKIAPGPAGSTAPTKDPDSPDSTGLGSPGPADVNGYSINRRTFYMGRLLKYAWQPDLKLRLVRRAASPRWVGREVHESLKVEGRTAPLANYLVHYSYKDFSAHMATTQKLAEVGAASYYARGRRARTSDFLLRPVFHLFKRLILKRAFLDGVPGLMAAWSGAVHSYMKMAFLWELQNKEKKK